MSPQSRLVAGIVHDRALSEHAEFVEAVSAFALTALDGKYSGLRTALRTT